MNGEQRDDTISNNQDYVKVLSTVAKAVYEFLDLHPDAIIEIEAVDEKRLRLYNLIFKRRYHEWRLLFLVEGYIGLEKELFNPDKDYWRFELQWKHR